jgi:integrase-like protein
VRTIDLDPETVEMLDEQRERQRFDRRAWGDAYRSDLDLVFCRPDGSPEDPDVIGRRFARRVAGLKSSPKIGLHCLRHTHAALLLAEGVDIKTVSERLGHDSVQTTLELCTRNTEDASQCCCAIRDGDLAFYVVAGLGTALLGGVTRSYCTERAPRMPPIHMGVMLLT